MDLTRLHVSARAGRRRDIVGDINDTGIWRFLLEIIGKRVKKGGPAPRFLPSSRGHKGKIATSPQRPRGTSNTSDRCGLMSHETFAALRRPESWVAPSSLKNPKQSRPLSSPPHLPKEDGKCVPVLSAREMVGVRGRTPTDADEKKIFFRPSSLYAFLCVYPRLMLFFESPDTFFARQ